MELRSRAVIPVNDIERQREQDRIDNQRILEKRAKANAKVPRNLYIECRLGYRLGAKAKQVPDQAFKIEGIRARLRQTAEALGTMQPIENTHIYGQAKNLWFELTGEHYAD